MDSKEMSKESTSGYIVKRSFSTPCDNSEEERISSSNPRLAKTPPLTPKKVGKMLALKIHLLDDTVTIIQAQTKALGRVVFEQICKQLNVLEADYFGLEYTDLAGTSYWLDLEKRLSRQMGLSLGDPMLRFGVKFYTPDPSQLEEEFTRYLFSLQIKRDLASGILQCNDNTAALMASYIVQAECGDWTADDYPDATYLTMYKFIPHQDYDIERKIRENHKKHFGQLPAEADLHLLETARKVELFGIRMHPSKDEDGVPLNLTVCHLGILVFQNFTKINTFSWAKIRKLSFKRKRFILKLHPEGYSTEGYYKELVEFIFETRNDCKSFWKRCVEHHAFFRCERAPNPIHRSKGILSSRGSSFRYSGRTQKQMVQFVRENFVKRNPNQHNQPPRGNNQQEQFHRSASFRSAQLQRQPSTPNVQPDVRGGQLSGVSTSCSSPAMIMDYIIDDRTGAVQEIEMSPLHTDSQEDNTLSAGTSVTSSPQRYNIPPLPVQGPAMMPSFMPQDADWFYSLSKELLNTHRTYVSDLQISNNVLFSINKTLQLQLEKQIESVKKEHWEFKHGIEMLNSLYKHFNNYKDKYSSNILHVFNNFQQFCQDDNYNSYIPLHAIQLKTIHRINYLVNDVLKQVMLPNLDTDPHIKTLYKKLEDVLQPLSEESKMYLKYFESIAKLYELNREMAGFPLFSFVNDSEIDACNNNKEILSNSPGPFLRQGILLKLNRKRGLQNRIFFLFRDHLSYGSRISSSAGFRLHGLIPTKDMKLQDSLLDHGIPHSFSIEIYDEKLLILAAFTEKDKKVWVADLEWSISESKGNIPNIKGSSEEILQQHTEINHNIVGHRSNSTLHVCWHRNISIDVQHLIDANQCNLSGYLLRKFKNSGGWQRLFCVFTNICLFFYKSHADSTALASLPLLGYNVEYPNKQDNINKDNTFKLAFKAHVYYFRCENYFAFNRWLRILQKATTT